MDSFTSSQALFDFCKSAIGTRWNIHGSDKIVCASFANIQVRQPHCGSGKADFVLSCLF